MKRILVTGGNKGIGFAIVQKLLTDYSDTYVFLGTRILSNGESARAHHLREHPSHEDRLELLRLDVSDNASVSEAAEVITSRYGNGCLHGLVNNAGIASNSIPDCVEVNYRGIVQVCDAFLPLLEGGIGAIVNVTSASGPLYVAKQSFTTRKLLTKPEVTKEEIDGYAKGCIEKPDGHEAYGLSKALANAYTLVLARENPGIRVHACTPGFIETDLTKLMAKKSNASPQSLGMKPPSEGAKAPVMVLLSEEKRYATSGRYFGSDGLRSPLDKYRAPGDPEYTGE